MSLLFQSSSSGVFLLFFVSSWLLLPLLHNKVQVVAAVVTVGNKEQEQQDYSTSSSSLCWPSPLSPYSIVIDGGSTGSRLHVFEFVEEEEEEEEDGNDTGIANDDNKRVSNTTSHKIKNCKCIRRGTERVNIPLSAFKPQPLHLLEQEQKQYEQHYEHGYRCSLRSSSSSSSSSVSVLLNASCVAEHILPLFEYVSDHNIIPSQYHNVPFPIIYSGTAGMRLLPTRDQEVIYDALYKGLLESDRFKFQNALLRSNLYTLSGELEGYYGAVAANYLKGNIHVDLSIRNTTTTTTTQQQSDKDTRMDNTTARKVTSPSSPSSETSTTPIIGALDMGGSSTQIVYLASSSSSSSFDNGDTKVELNEDDDDTDPHTCHISDYNDEIYKNQGNKETHYNANNDNIIKISNTDFFSTSYLSYGVDEFRERLWTTWVTERKKMDDDNRNKNENYDPTIDGYEEGDCSTKWISNPCSFKGYNIEWMGYTLLGSGNAYECMQQIKRLIPHPDYIYDDHLIEAPATQATTDPSTTTSSKDDDAIYNAKNDTDSTLSHDLYKSSPFHIVGGIQHPPIQRGHKFYAMSLYFFTLDSLRVLSNNKQNINSKKHHDALNLSWPTPSIVELYNALDGLCSREWQSDLYEIRHNSHTYTRAEVLPYRCFESVYLVTLLKDGYGFDLFSRDITFTFQVNDSEVEWALGLAIVQYAEKQNDVCKNDDYYDGNYDGNTGDNEDNEEKEDSGETTATEATERNTTRRILDESDDLTKDESSSYEVSSSSASTDNPNTSAYSTTAHQSILFVPSS